MSQIPNREDYKTCILGHFLKTKQNPDNLEWTEWQNAGYEAWAPKCGWSGVGPSVDNVNQPDITFIGLCVLNNCF